MATSATSVVQRVVTSSAVSAPCQSAAAAASARSAPSRCHLRFSGCHVSCSSRLSSPRSYPSSMLLSSPACRCAVAVNNVCSRTPVSPSLRPLTPRGTDISVKIGGDKIAVSSSSSSSSAFSPSVHRILPPASSACCVRRRLSPAAAFFAVGAVGRGAAQSRGACGATESAPFLGGGGSNLRHQCPNVLSPPRVRGRGRGSPARASADDTRKPTGFPPMQSKPQWFWRVLAVAPYIIPVSELWLSAEGAYLLNPLLEVLEDAFLPILLWYHGQRFLPLITFFALFLGVVRNQQFWPHFVRYHTLNSVLMEIIIMVATYLVKLLPASIAENVMIVPWVSLIFTLWITITVFYSIACAIKGMYSDIPFISDAVYMQIPVDV
ncbi:hypothetical protein CBR_g49334 [Chara braunii]|uniref:Protein TIC 20 n=1 Tax=Chara braunii TaxID=69332 RepID=A0A388M4N5_CHABU|nr:hypothetical protein CBR_g49334 [Chara braunii]|eukprot:GBG89544.1 hypothetical protein CBR_g49334 [Chara braunii]